MWHECCFISLQRKFLCFANFTYTGKKMKKIVYLFVSLFVCSSVHATIVDFTGINHSNVNSFTIGDVTFTDSIGNGLTTGAWPESNNSQALAVFGDDASRLELSFDNTYDFLSFDFGNDNPGFGDPNGQMHLDLYLNGVQTGSFALTANWDDLMNQNLSGTGLFNYAEIYYDTNLIEVIDNIEYRLDNPVPEPTSIALLGLGLAGIVFTRRKRKLK